MATLNARMRLLYDKNYFTEGAPMRRYNNPYYIASSQKLLFDILQQQKANNNKSSVTSKINRTPLQAKPTLTSDTKAPAEEKATPKAKERTPPKSAPVKTPVTPAKKPVTPAKTPAKSTSGTTTNLRGGAKGGAASVPIEKTSGKKTPLTDDADDDDDISTLTARKQARITKEQAKEELSAFNLWKKIHTDIKEKQQELVKQRNALNPLNKQAILRLTTKIKEKQTELDQETRRNPRTRYKQTLTKAEYKKVRDALIGTNKKLKKDLRDEEAKSGGQDTPAYEAIKGRKRYYKAKLKQLDASNSKN
tara:strand:- start:266 stop:1183 length:918 start_codon:yes stop_codon:yes gene_type:complete